MGRVQVQYRMLREGAAQKPSNWAFVCTPYASSESGGWFVPEVGDEVLVVVNGDMNNPIVMGSLFNPKNKPPVSGRTGDRNSNGRNDLKFIRTRSGHLLCFDDSDSNRAIELSDKEGRKLVIDSQKSSVLISDAAGNQIEISSDKIQLKNKSGAEIQIQGDSANIKASKISLSGSEIKIDAASKVELGEGASEALVKGQSFMSLFNSHTHVAPPMGGPTSPPMMPMTPGQLSQKVKTA